jgi:transposase
MTREEATALVYGNPEAAVDLILQLVETVERLSARVAELERKIAVLTRDSSNSSKPPSSDGPGGAPKARAPMKSKKRKAGGQPGHKGSTRKLVPVEDVDRVIPVFPDSCAHCGAVLVPDPEHSSGKYWRHQVVDIPEPKPEVTEYHLHGVQCSCGAENWGKLPRRARSGFGPRLTALLAHLTGLHRVTRRGCQEITKTIFGIDIGLGSVCTLHREVSESLAAGYREAREALPEQPNVNIDETGWKTQGEGRWLWTVVAPGYEYFHVAASRGAKVLRDMLGDVYQGILCSDMYSAYKAFHRGLRQFCWAHIIRGIKGIKHGCRSPDAVRFSKWMLSEIGRLFGLWHAFQGSDIDRQSLIKKSVPMRSRMSRCLQLHCAGSDRDAAKMAKSLIKHWHGLFTFLEYRGIEPTNNAAERALRPAVQWRKICFGNQSPEGELLTARLLTAERSCIRQGRNAFRFLVDSVNAYRHSLPGPSLLMPSC